MFNDRIQIGRDLLNVPMGEMIKDMAFAIAEAQMKLDTNSMEVAEMMGGLISDVDANGATTFTDSRVYFGQDRITKTQAVDLHNSTADLVLREDIVKKLPDAEAPVDGDGVMSLNSTTVGSAIITIPQKLSMLELGFTPTFYQFVDTIIEVKITIKYTAEQSFKRDSSLKIKAKATNGSGHFFSRNRNRNKTVVTSQTNATFAQKFSYSAEGSSLLRTKLVPIPAPAILEERIRKLMEVARETPA